MEQSKIEKYQELLEACYYNVKEINFSFKVDVDEKIKVWLDSINLLFSFIIKHHPELNSYLPYQVRIHELVEKNEWTKGIYIAVEKDDGSLDLHLNLKQLSLIEKLPINGMVWMFFHEFRHKMQLTDEVLQSVINHSNWNNFKNYMIKETGKDEDIINHIFHELNPAEVDAHIFACQITGIKFKGTVFDITEEKLKMLKK